MASITVPKRRNRLLLPVVVVLIAFLLVAFLRMRRDVTPPLVTATVQSRIPANLPFPVRLSANEQSDFLISYGGRSYEASGRTLEFELLGAVGNQELEVVARDRFGNEERYSFPVYGIPEIQPLVQAPDTARPGQPLSVRVAWPPTSIPLKTVDVRFKEQPLRVFPTDENAVALTSVPLGTEAGDYELLISLVDGFDRTVEVRRTVRVAEDVRPVQNLNMGGGTADARNNDNVALEAEVMRQAYEGSVHTSAPLWTEPFIMPLSGRSTSGYGTPRRYFTGGAVSFHHGADIAAPLGTPIAASNRGEVVVTGFFPIKGGLVVIDHGANVFSLYFHQSVIRAQVGDFVERGDIIGEVGSTGLSTGPHLHWEMRVNTISTDPLAWVDRLLP